MPIIMTIRNEINNIQGLRAFAAILVVMFHTLGIANAYGYKANFLYFLIGYGYSGVDLFFVISGFIMVYIQKRKISTPLKFIINRILRIAPLYWTLSILLFVIFNIAPTVFNTENIGAEKLIKSLLFLVQFSGRANFPILFDGWTLEYEMFFYGVFAISLWFKSIHKSIIFSSVAIILWYVLAGNLIVFEFLLGMWIGLLYVSNRAFIKNGSQLFLIGLILFCLPVFFKDISVNRFFLYGLPSSLIVCGAVWMSQISISVLTKIGDASYSIYLIQVFTISAYFKIIKTLKLTTVYSDIYIVGCIVVTVISGYALFVYFEKNVERILLPLKKLIG
jgi:exopolysaccharide production protein ExoZ